MALTDPEEARRLLGQLIEQPKKFLFGIDQAITNCVLALITSVPRDGKTGKEYAQAHVYLLDLPGKGKTATFNYLSSALRAKLGRIDGRPDTMPSDIIGREWVDRHTGIRTLLKGPLHSHIIFFDEINRTPPKSQSPLLGAMEGGYVMMNVTDVENQRIESVPFPLYPLSEEEGAENFFIVFATANPLELEGTYPLSEAQQDRFTYSFRMGLPPREYEKMIRAENVVDKQVEQIMDLKTLLDIQKMVRDIKLSEEASEMIMRIIENSRPESQDLNEYSEHRKRYAKNDLIGYVNKYVDVGCSPRRNFHMEAAAKAFAFMRGVNGDSGVATVDDVRAIIPLTSEHVIVLDSRCVGDNVTAKNVIEQIMKMTEVP